MSDAPQDLSLRQYVQQSLESIKAGNQPPDDLFDKVASFPEWIDLLKKNNAADISALLIDGDAETVTPILEDLSSYINGFTTEYSRPTSTEDYITTTKIHPESNLPPADQLGAPPTESLKRAAPSIREDVLRRSKEQRAYIGKLMTEYNRQTNFWGINQLKEQLQSELSKPTRSSKPEEIQQELKDRSVSVLQKFGQEDKAQRFVEAVVNPLAPQIAMERAKTTAMIEEIIETPTAPADYHALIIRNYSAAKIASRPELAPITRAARIETGALNIKPTQIAPQELSRVIKDTYDNGSPQTKLILTQTLSAVSGKEIQLVEKTLKKPEGAKEVNDFIVRAEKYKSAKGRGFGSLFSTNPNLAASPDAQAYKAAYEKSPTFEPSLEHIVVVARFTDKPANFFEHNGILSEFLFHLGEENLKRRVGGAVAKQGLLAIAGKLGLSAAVPGAGLAETALTWLGGKISGLLSGGVRFNIFDFKTSKEDQQVSAGIMIFLGVVVALSFFGGVWFTEVDRFAFSPFGVGGATSQSGSSNTGLTPGLPVYNGGPLTPSDITECPTQQAFELTQCPGGSFTHSNVDAYDLATPVGTEIRATHDGVVSMAGAYGDRFSAYGNMVTIKGVDTAGNGYYTAYGHLSVIFVSPGTQVSTGTPIGLSGNTGNSTGPHLHYEYRTADNRACTNCNVNFLKSTCTTNPSACGL